MSSTFTLYAKLPEELQAQIADDAMITDYPVLSSIAKGPAFAYMVDPDAQLDLSHVDRAMRARSLYTKGRAEVTSILNATGLRLPKDPRASPEGRRMWELIENGTVKELVFATGRPGDSTTSPGFARASQCLDYISQYCPSHAIETLTFDENIRDCVQGRDDESLELSAMTLGGQNLMNADGSTCTHIQFRGRPNTSREFSQRLTNRASAGNDRQLKATIWEGKEMKRTGGGFFGAWNPTLNYDVTGAQMNEILDSFKYRCRMRVKAMNREYRKNPSSTLTTTINLYATRPPSAAADSIESNELTGLADELVEAAEKICPAGSTNSLVVNVGHCDEQSYRVHHGRPR